MKFLTCLIPFLIFVHANKQEYDAGVPVVDFKVLLGGGEAGEAEKKILLGAFENVGFFVITNHGVPKKTMDETWEMGKAFFDTTLDNKNEVKMSDEYMYGYTAAEILSRSETDEGHGFAPDDKESINLMIGSMNSSHDPARYPSKPENMKEVFEDYYRHIEILVSNLLRVTAGLLELEPDFFEDKLDDHTSVLRILNYPQQTAQPKGHSIRCSPHTDYGTFTFLRQDNVGGLQVEKEHMSDEWIDVKTNFYDFSVNIGDLFRRWTNDRFRSTRHRVQNAAANKWGVRNRRQSVVFFHNLNFDAEVKTIPSCLVNGKTKYEPITFQAFIEAKHHATQIYNEDGESELKDEL